MVFVNVVSTQVKLKVILMQMVSFFLSLFFFGGGGEEGRGQIKQDASSAM